MTGLPCHAKYELPFEQPACRVIPKYLNMYHSVLLKWVIGEANCFEMEALLLQRATSHLLQESWTVLTKTSTWIRHTVADFV